MLFLGAVYPHGNTLMKMRDAPGTIYQDQSFVSLFPHNGRAVEAPWRLALIPVLQFVEGLPDRQAADAVRGRIDWKYLLGLELADPGFDASVLSAFRKRLVQGEAEHLLLNALLALCKERAWLKARINLVRLVDWLDGNPLAPTRVSAFERLYKAA